MIGDADVISIKRKPKPMSKKPELKHHPLAKVEVFEYGKVIDTYWVVMKPDGTEVQYPTYERAFTYQQANPIASSKNVSLDKKVKV